ncbi:unnamed protein product [Blepharisma stoltei]|uniref:Uncharacterized protein n=1 Tax=Blepharisma stoltei TaxID=1481888 RepID=A0AAU9IYB1_9CILI|nr:unnamed protein product [Blepharisma stoltei]
METTHHEGVEIDPKLTDIALEQNPSLIQLPSSDNDTWPSWPSSPHSNLERGMDEYLDKMFEDKTESQEESPTAASSLKKKRGRRPLRPHDPIKKKTEEKDKYWLRAFRAYMKELYPKISDKMGLEEQVFWNEHLGSNGKPEKGNRFLSYGKRYKNYLFTRPYFVTLFQDWFKEHGKAELSKKCKPGSDLWFVFYDYATKDLLNYVPTGSSSIDGRESPLSCASPPGETQDEMVNEPMDFFMVDNESEDIIESFFN